MAHIVKNITLYSRAPFDVTKKNVALGKVAGGGVGTLGIASVLNSAKVLDFNLGYSNFRIDDNVVVIPLNVEATAIFELIHSINYMKIKLSPIRTGEAFDYYAFVTRIEILDTDTQNRQGVGISGGVGAIAFYFQIDAWTTFITCGQSPQQTQLKGGVLTRFSDSRAINILTGLANLYPRKLPIEPIAETDNYDEITVNPTISDEDLEGIPPVLRYYNMDINIPQGITPWAWALGGYRPNGVDRQNWVCCVIVSYVHEGITITKTLVGVTLTNYADMIKQANYAGDAIYIGYLNEENTVNDWVQVTIKNVYLVPRSVVRYSKTNNVVLLSKTQNAADVPAAFHFYFSQETTSYLALGNGRISTNEDMTKICTFGTPFNRVFLEQLNRESNTVRAVVEFSFGGNSLRVTIKAGADVIDVTQDFEYLTAKDLSNKYWQENKGTNAIQALANLGALAGGIISKNPVAIVGSLFSTAQQAVNISQGLKQAPQVTGNGYVDVTALYGGVYVQTHNAINAEAVENAIKRQGIEVYKPISGAWNITNINAISTMITAGVKSFFLQAVDVDVSGIPQDYAAEIREMLETGVHVFLDIAKFTNRNYD